MSQKHILRAMAANYRNGHSFDALDGEVCSKAADEIDVLEAKLDAANARADKLEGKLALAEAQLCDVAEIVHKGGLRNMTESDALIAIRRATLPHFNASAIASAKAGTKCP